jgi:hypothetical protein
LEQVDPINIIEELRQLLSKLEAAQWIVDTFSATHASTTGVAYVQYLQDKKYNVLEAIQQSLAVIIDTHQGKDMEPNEQLRIVNTGSSTSNRHNKQL